MKWLQAWVSRRTPWIFENSKLPVWLSKIAPIEINALSFACFVFCRGELNKTTRRHEIIHYHQQIEMMFIFQWVMYGFFWLVGLVRYRSAPEAYRQNPFEREAYDNQKKYTYIEKRPLWNWIHYVKG